LAGHCVVPDGLMCSPTESQDSADLSWEPSLNPLADDVEKDSNEDNVNALHASAASYVMISHLWKCPGPCLV
jgi:hypothetical protein